MAAQNTMAPRLDVVGATSGYGQTNVISNVTFSLAPGETLAILGKICQVKKQTEGSRHMPDFIR